MGFPDDQPETSSKSLFDGFQVTQVLHQDDRTKSMAVLGRWVDKPDQAIVLLHRRPFDSSAVHDVLTNQTSTSVHFTNDVYAKVTETCQYYEQFVVPYIQSLPESRIQWVRNILDKKAEADRLLYEDPDPETGFMLHPDLKWDQKQKDGMYCIALCHRRDILSIRSLNSSHLPLLRNIKQKAFQAIQDKFDIPDNQIRAYVHYHPSYYHFHVHLMHVKVDFGAGMAVGKAHLLDDIIENIAMSDGNHYAQRTLYFMLGQNDPLYQTCFCQHTEAKRKSQQAAEGDGDKAEKKPREM